MAALAGQVALVTGGSRGIGRAVAEALAGDGAAVGLVARSPETLDEAVGAIAGRGGRAAAAAADVTDAGELANAMAALERRLGPPTLLVANAGTAAAIGPVWEVDPGEWWRDVETSLRGAFLAARAVLPGMIDRRAGRIVNIASYVAVRPSPHLSAYAAAKAALVSLTESLAAEAAPAGVAVFAVSPGHVRTDLVRHLLESDAGRRWLPELASSKPVEPAIGAELVRFVATGAADGLSGRFLHVHDDVEALARRADEVVRDDLLVPRLR